MQVGSSSDITKLITELRKPKKDNGEPFDAVPPKPEPPAASGDSLESLIAQFQARLALSSFQRNDLNGDGYVERGEFMTQNLKPRETYTFKEEEVAGTWDKIDKNGTGRLSQEEYTDAFSSVFTVSAGRFDKPLT